jgi:hypothetical protein
LLDLAGPTAIQHLPKPLYHRRVRPTQVKSNMIVRSRARKASMRALFDHLERSGEEAAVEPGISPDSLRMRRQAPPTVRVAVFVRQEDGNFQISTVNMGMNRGREILLYEVKDCAVYPALSASQPALLTLNDIPAEVLIFVNRPLESLNHLFFDELTAQAVRKECGLVTGISVDVEKRVLQSGFVSSMEGHLVDPCVGFEFSQVTHLDLMNVTRSVETISDHFFAVRHEYLAAVGGLSAVSTGQMPQLVHKLVTNANREGLRVIVTPFSVASFHQTRPNVPPDPVRLQNQGAVSLNPNLLAFEDLTQAVRGVF